MDVLKLYRIGNICLAIKMGTKELEKVWEKYKSVYNDRADIFFEIATCRNQDNMLEQFDILDQEKWCYRYDTEIFFSDKEWKHIRILPLINDILLKQIIHKAFYTHAVQHHMIQFHSSLIDYQGHGLMFLGPSGIGKTTQAELWDRYRDALIINGDIVFVQETEEAFLGWGTPWHGSSPYCENTNVPVDALIILKQAPENSIRQLEGFEKVTAVSNSVFYPRWLENGMELCLETLDHLLSKIPVYELSCRPDEEAVELTEKTIFGREH